MASHRRSADVELDGFEAYVNMTLREAAKMLASEHQRLMQLRCHQPPSPDESLERKRARAMVARRSNESQDAREGLGSWNRMTEDKATVQRLSNSRGGSRSCEPLSADGSRSQLRDQNRGSDMSTLTADMWTELQGQITPSRGSLHSVHSTGKRFSTGSVESELVCLNQVVPYGPRISVMGADRTSLHSVNAEPAEDSLVKSSTNSRLSVQSLHRGSRFSINSAVSSDADKAPDKAPRKNSVSARLSDVGKSALAWISRNENAPDEARNSASVSPGSISARNSHSSMAAPRSAMPKKPSNAHGKSAGLLNMLTKHQKKDATPTRQVSFLQCQEEVEECGAGSESIGERLAKPPKEVEPIPPPPVGQLLAEDLAGNNLTSPDVVDSTEAKRPANDFVVPIPADDVKTLVVEYTSPEGNGKDMFNGRPESPTASYASADIAIFQGDKALQVSKTGSTRSKQSAGLDQPEDSLMARVARQASREAMKDRENSRFESPLPSVSLGDFSRSPSVKTDVTGTRFPMLEIWTERVSTIGVRGPPLSKGLTHLSSDDIMQEVDEHEENKYHIEMKRAPFTPNTRKRLLWDLVASFLVVYECIVIPLQFIGLGPAWVTSFAWIVRIFWVIDMPLSFLTGYVLTDGTHEMRLHKVAGRYLSTWFIVDLVVLVTDWAEVFLDDMSYAGAARAGKTAKTIRLLRMARIARLFKFKKLKTPEVLEVLMETIFSPELLPVIFNLFKIVCIFAWINHVMACLWYSIGEAEYGAMDWIKGHEMSHMPKEYIYLSAYHWSLQQFAGAAEVWPWNMEERTFAVIFGVITFVAAGAFVSSLTSSMTHFEIINSQDSKRMTQLKHFLFDSHISHAVAMRVQRNAKHALKEEKRNMPESSIELLPKLSEPLRMEIHYDMHMPLLASHPFFKLYNEISPFMMRNVCHNACLDLKLSAGDVLFCEGEVPKDQHVFFVKHGCMNYRHHTGSKENAGPGKWASEAGVWCTWIHCGSMVALEECTLLVLVAPKFQSVCSHFLKEIEYARQYGRGFLKHLNNANESELTDLEDPEMDIEWLAMQTCPHFVRQAGLVGRLMRRSSRNVPGSTLRRSSTMKQLRRGLSGTLSKTLGERQ